MTVHDVGDLLFGGHAGFARISGSSVSAADLSSAARLIAVSNATRRQVETLMDVPPGRIRTIYNAPDPAFVEPNLPAIACVGEETFRFRPEMQRIWTASRSTIRFSLCGPHESSEERSAAGRGVCRSARRTAGTRCSQSG